MGKDSENKVVCVQKDFTEPVIGFFGNVLVGSSRNFTVTEERYLMLLVAKASEQLSKYKNLSGNRFKPDKAICPKYIYFSPRVLLTKGSKKNDEIKKAAVQFAQKTITADTRDNNGKKITRIVHLAGPIDISIDDINNSYIKLKIEQELWELILDMTKGYSYLDIRYLFRLSRPEAMRLLPIFYNSSLFKKESQNTYDMTYNLNTLKHMFGLDKSYKTNTGVDDYANFMKKVIIPALDEIRDSGCPFYADYELLPGSKEKGQRGKSPMNRIRFIPRRNLTVFQSIYPCLLPGNSPIRSPRVQQLLEQKYHFGSEIPKQVENIICFAQKFISNDEDLWNVLYDIYPYVRNYDKGVEVGLINQLSRHMKKTYDVDYVAPSKLKKEKEKIAREGRKYTDWELISLPDADLDLSSEDVERLKALTEAQEILGKTDFQNIVDQADQLQKEQEELNNAPVKLVYGIEHLTDEQIFENIKAGIIDDANVEKYDEDSYKRLEFMISIIFDSTKSKEEKTWEAVSAALKDKFNQGGPSETVGSPSLSEVTGDSPTLSSREYEEMMDGYDKWVAGGDPEKVNDLF